MQSVSRERVQPGHHPLPPQPRSRCRRLRRARPRRRRRAASCRRKPTSRSSRSRKPTRSRSSTWRSPPTATRRSRSPTTPSAWSRTACRPSPAWRRRRSTAARYAMRVWLQPQRLAGFGLTPAGRGGRAARAERRDPRRPRRRQRARVHRAVGDRPEDAGAVRQHHPRRRRRLRWCACATWRRSSWASRTTRFRARYNGKNAVPLGIVKQAVANPLDISDALRGDAAADHAQRCRRA